MSRVPYTFDERSAKLIVQQVTRLRSAPLSTVPDKQHKTPQGGGSPIKFATITETGGIAYGATGEITWRDSTDTATVANKWFEIGDVSEGLECAVTKFAGEWQIIAIECEPDPDPTSVSPPV
jgi:hypothetical protein